jgi:hypothetical protein
MAEQSIISYPEARVPTEEPPFWMYGSNSCLGRVTTSSERRSMVVGKCLVDFGDDDPDSILEINWIARARIISHHHQTKRNIRNA